MSAEPPCRLRAMPLVDSNPSNNYDEHDGSKSGLVPISNFGGHDQQCPKEKSNCHHSYNTVEESHAQDGNIADATEVKCDADEQGKIGSQTEVEVGLQRGQSGNTEPKVE